MRVWSSFVHVWLYSVKDINMHVVFMVKVHVMVKCLGWFGTRWDWCKPRKPNGRFVFARLSEKVEKNEIW